MEHFQITVAVYQPGTICTRKLHPLRTISDFIARSFCLEKLLSHDVYLCGCRGALASGRELTWPPKKVGFRRAPAPGIFTNYHCPESLGTAPFYYERRLDYPFD